VVGKTHHFQRFQGPLCPYSTKNRHGSPLLISIRTAFFPFGEVAMISGADFD
jgi:hypothetical protein